MPTPPLHQLSDVPWPRDRSDATSGRRSAQPPINLEYVASTYAHPSAAAVAQLLHPVATDTRNKASAIPLAP
jgi:hypothetical protein